jgi:outer membrane immunogenic protein
MKQLLTAIAAIALIGTPAFAADMAVEAPPPAPVPAPVYSWTGWYVGGNVGGIWGGDSINVNATNLEVCSVACGGLATAVASAQGTTGVFSGHNNGFIGGGQLGYNWQFANWVAGFEADVQGVGAKDNGGASTATVGLVGFPGSFVTTNVSVTKEIDYLGTVRGRLGWFATPSLLVYGTGGLAYGGVKASTNATSSFIGAFKCRVLNCNPSTSSDISQTRTGWTAGGGFEWMWAPRWSVKVEYLYYDLGRVTYNSLLVDSCTNCAGVPFFTNNVQTTTRFNGNIVRVGLNYQFH